MKPIYTDTQLKKLLKSAIILIDTREQENQHIKDYFKKHNIETIEKKLDYGDYGIMIPENAELNFPQTMISEHTVERKGSLDELVGNIANERTRLENEFIRCKGNMSLVIENASMNDVLLGNYRSEYTPTSLKASLWTFYARYDITYTFTQKCDTAQIIYGLLYYKLREELK